MRRASILLVLSVALLAPGGGYAAPRKSGPPPACAGRDIFTAMKRSDPEGYARIRAAADAVPNTGALLWRVEGKNQPPSYLFGTIHSTDERVTKLSPAVVAAFNAAQHRGARIPRKRDAQVLARATDGRQGLLCGWQRPEECVDTGRTRHAAQDARRGRPSGQRDPSVAAMARGVHARASALREAARRSRPCLSRSAHRARCDRAGQAGGRRWKRSPSRSARWTACRMPCRSGCSRRRSPPSACAMTRLRWCTALTSRAISRLRYRSANGSSSGPGMTPRRSTHSSATSAREAKLRHARCIAPAAGAGRRLHRGRRPASAGQGRAGRALPRGRLYGHADRVISFVSLQNPV